MKLVPAAISRGMGRQLLLAQKNSPGILFGVGVVGMVGSTVLACRATLKLETSLEKTKHDLEIAKAADYEERDLTERDRKKDIAIIYNRGAFSMIKLYAPSILLGAASIACLAKSHNILTQRNAALTAAYIAVDEAFKQYRGRVVAKYGEDEDRELRYGSEPVELIDSKGKITHSTRVGIEGPSMYARFFDQLSPEWSPDAEYNLYFLSCQQTYFNQMLISRGHVFLNEVYDGLGIDRSEAGAVVGWIRQMDGGDNFIDFGLYDGNAKAREFVNGREGSILLDFNVDGLIFDKLDNPKKLKWQS